MRAVFEHARTVRWITARVFGDALADGAPARRSIPVDAAGVLEALALAAERGERPSAPCWMRSKRSILDDPVAWTPADP